MAATERYLQLADVAAGQWGLVTTAHARRVGLTHQQLTRMARSGILHRLHHGVYRLAGVPPDPFTGLKVSWLALDPEATAADRLERSDPVGVVSHRSAARVHQLGDLDADVNEFTLSTGKRTRDPDTRLYKRDLDRSDWQVIGGLPITTVGVTLADLAAATTDGGHLGGVLRDAILHAKITYLDAAAVLRPYAHEYGAPLGNGRALVKTLLAQTGLSKTIAAAAQFDDPEDTWLTDQLNTAASRYLGGTAFRRAADQLLVDEELMGATDFYGFRRQPGNA